MKLNQRGVSLAGVLIGVGILGVISVGTLQVIDQQLRGQRAQKFTNEMENFHETMRAALSDQSACLNSFPGVTLSSGMNTSVNRIVDKNDQVLLDMGNGTGTYDDSLMQVRSLNLVDYTEDSDDPLQGKTTLVAIYEPQGSILGLTSYEREIEIRTARDDTSNALVQCISYSKMVAGIWRRTQADSDHIFFAGGNVGIETSNPTARLEVNGALKLSNTTATCDASTEGQQKYNPSTRSMEFCNGTSWMAMGVPSRAVMAFNANQCPDGWSPLAGAQRKVIVGSDGSSGYRAGNTGGSYNISFTLSEAQIPLPVHVHNINPPLTNVSSGGSHSHRYVVPQSRNTQGGGSAGSVYRSHARTREEGAHVHTVDIAPFESGPAPIGGGPVNNAPVDIEHRQPYIALLYCQKD